MNTTHRVAERITRHPARTMTALSVISVLAFGACGGNDDDASDADLTEFCAKAAETNAGPLPSAALLAEYQALAPDEIAEPVAVIVDAFEAAGPDPTAVFSDPAVVDAIGQVTAFEAEACGFEPPRASG